MLEGRQGEPGADIGGLCMSCCYGGFAGGVEIEVVDASEVRAIHTTFVGGQGGIYGGGNGCNDGVAAPPVRIAPGSTLTMVGCTFVEPAPIEGTVDVIAETPRTVSAPSSVVASETFTLELVGEPGDTAFLFGGGKLVSRPQTPEEGFFQVVGVGRRRLGSLPLSGVQTV